MAQQDAVIRLLLVEDRLDDAEQIISHLRNGGMAVRPHIKTHKLPQVALMQLKAGAVGITCQKISEAEARVAVVDRLNDVLITYNILGGEKLAHLRELDKKAKK